MDFKTGLVVGFALALVLAAGALILLDSDFSSTGAVTAVQSDAGVEQVASQGEANAAGLGAPEVVQEDVQIEAPSQRESFGLYESDLPGFTVTANQIRLLGELPPELQDVYSEFGFVESHEVWLQEPVVPDGREIGEDFRQVQSNVFVFSDAEGAQKFFEKQREGAQASPDLVEFTNVSAYGEGGFAYVEVYERGEVFEQHYAGFLLSNSYSLVSVTALASANMSADLVFQAASALESKMLE